MVCFLAALSAREMAFLISVLVWLFLATWITFSRLLSILFFAKQGSVLSAALVIMTMIVASRLLGLVRQRTLASLFTADQLSVFFAAFRLPDLVFEILVFGTFSSAFIPVFSRLVRKDEKDAWLLSSRVMNVALLIFCCLAVIFSILAPNIYRLIAPGYGFAEQLQIV